jgi:hypothetical protein
MPFGKWPEVPKVNLLPMRSLVRIYIPQLMCFPEKRYRVTVRITSSGLHQQERFKLPGNSKIQEKLYGNGWLSVSD